VLACIIIKNVAVYPQRASQQLEGRDELMYQPRLLMTPNSLPKVIWVLLSMPGFAGCLLRSYLEPSFQFPEGLPQLLATGDRSIVGVGIRYTLSP
jgi:hypothetical protein